jgi:hypothetical protein
MILGLREFAALERDRDLKPHLGSAPLRLARSSSISLAALETTSDVAMPTHGTRNGLGEVPQVSVPIGTRWEPR